MEHVIFSILTSVIGLGVGAVSVIIYSNKKEKRSYCYKEIHINSIISKENC